LRAPPPFTRRFQLGIPRARGWMARAGSPLRDRPRPGAGDGTCPPLSRDREWRGRRDGRVLHRRPTGAVALAHPPRRSWLLPRLLGGAGGAKGAVREVPAHLGAAP